MLTVMNPRNIEAGVSVLAVNVNGEETQWYAGQEFVPPEGMEQSRVDALLASGALSDSLLTVDGITYPFVVEETEEAEVEPSEEEAEPDEEEAEKVEA
jgi:hypothetical protein